MMPTQRIPDPYATLGVGRDATPAQLRAAYRRLAKRYHPDLRSDADATAQMRRVNQAWEIVSSPSRRAEYDAGVASRAASAAGGHWAGVPRQAPRPEAANPPWATYGSGPLYGNPGAYGHAATGLYAERRSEGLPRPLFWAALLLLVPVTVLATAVLSAGILPFPLLAFLVPIVASRLFGRDR